MIRPLRVPLVVFHDGHVERVEVVVDLKAVALKYAARAIRSRAGSAGPKDGTLSVEHVGRVAAGAAPVAGPARAGKGKGVRLGPA